MPATPAAYYPRRRVGRGRLTKHGACVDVWLGEPARCTYKVDYLLVIKLHTFLRRLGELARCCWPAQILYDIHMALETNPDGEGKGNREFAMYVHVSY